MSVHDLQAPKEDRALLAYPSLEQAGRLLEENRRRLEACRLEILGRPLQSLRSLARQTVLNLAQEYMAAPDVGLAIEDGDGSLDFRVGPLREGGARGLLSELEVPGFGGSLERLVDNVSVEEPDGGEFLVLTINSSD